MTSAAGVAARFTTTPPTRRDAPECPFCDAVQSVEQIGRAWVCWCCARVVQDGDEGARRDAGPALS
jgi:hypothetical protein